MITTVDLKLPGSAFRKLDHERTERTEKNTERRPKERRKKTQKNECSVSFDF
jgi:hypothetical protein